MAEAASRLYVPALGGIYSALNEYAEPILRIGLGAILIPHGMQKLFGAFGGMGLTSNAALFERLGYTPGMFWGRWSVAPSSSAASCWCSDCSPALPPLRC